MQYSEIFWGVLSTFAAFLAGLAWQHLTRVLTHLRARRFWGPLVSSESVVVVGSFRDLPGFEASGLIGMGDNIALNDLRRYFARIGFKRFSVHYSEHLDWARTGGESPLQGNLILIGGPDANQVTRLILERVVLGIEFVEVPPEHLSVVPAATPGPAPAPGRVAGLYRTLRRRRTDLAPVWRVPVVLDRESGRLFGPLLERGEVRRDCGVVIRCPNPFNARREVIMFCGSYGYGTWGAVRYAQTQEFLTAVPRGVGSLECVLSVEVVAQSPQGIGRELLRPLRDPVRVGGESIVVPRIVD